LWGEDNPARGVRRHSTHSRERVFSDVELMQLFTYQEFCYQKLSTFITVLLCTGCRMSEARLMQWAHVDLEQAVWRKPTTKNGMAHRLPLPTQALQAIQAMPREGDYVFMGIYGHCWSRCGVEKAWSLFRKVPNLESLRLHDFRRTVASRIYEQTKDEKLVKAIINHHDNTMSGVYIRLQYERLAEALQAHADAIWRLRAQSQQSWEKGAPNSPPQLTPFVRQAIARPTSAPPPASLGTLLPRSDDPEGDDDEGELLVVA
jgi:integrase